MAETSPTLKIKQSKEKQRSSKRHGARLIFEPQRDHNSTKYTTISHLLLSFPSTVYWGRSQIFCPAHHGAPGGREAARPEHRRSCSRHRRSPARPRRLHPCRPLSPSSSSASPGSAQGRPAEPGSSSSEPEPWLKSMRCARRARFWDMESGWR